MATIALVAAGVIYAAVFGEAFLRLFGSRYLGEPGRSYIRPPYHYSKALGAPFRTNGWGLRGRDFREGALRIVTLGGSATESAEVPEEESWPYRLEVELNALGGGRPGQVANAGMAGTASAHYLAHLNELAGPVGIDVAVIFTGINDADRLARYGSILSVEQVGDSRYAEALFQAFSRPDPVRLGELDSSPPVLRSRLALFLKGFGVKTVGQPLRNRLEDFVPGQSLREKRARLRASAEYPVILSRAADDYERNILLMIEAARKFGVTPLFVTMPVWSEKEDPELPVLNARLVEVCAREEAPFVDLASIKLPEGESWFGPVGHHLGKDGAARMGKILAAAVARLVAQETPEPSSPW
ncbi:MAG: GDSL-type esterase/lipase family protein [Deltaproteobacteria bacterium]|nr:GDSL-type esterase/lipase family protein [Deltaproteobacteria bacterium]